jgi:hypothetical protein
LIWRDKFLRATVKHRLRDPSEIRALDFKGEFRRSAICSPSATIAINGSIIRLLQRQPNICSTAKIPSAPSRFGGGKSVDAAAISAFRHMYPPIQR